MALAILGSQLNEADTASIDVIDHLLECCWHVDRTTDRAQTVLMVEVNSLPEGTLCTLCC